MPGSGGPVSTPPDETSTPSLETPTSTPDIEPTASITPPPTPEVTLEPSSTPSQAPTPTPYISSTPTPGPNETPFVGTPSPTPGGTPTLEPVETPTPEPTPIPTPTPDGADDDGDGFSEREGDCDDLDPERFPGASEQPYDGIDQDCDGKDLTDVDEDGYDALEAAGDDCDDGNPAIHPDAPELCDGLDNDCDGELEAGTKKTYYQDFDKDGYGDAESSTVACNKPKGYVTNPLDCDDSDANVYPSAPEICNEIDDDCDLEVDEGVEETFYRDLDQDGYGNSEDTTAACSPPSGYVVESGDCKDTNDSIHPNAAEVCNNVDDNCDGEVDEQAGVVFYADADGDSYGDPEGATYFCANPTQGYVSNTEDCDDEDPDVYPGAQEICNEKDDDCDLEVDEEGQLTFYEDVDNDGFGDPDSPYVGCSPPEGYVTDNTDCKDTNDAVYPGQTEIANGVDDNCNGEVDEGVFFPNCKAIKQALPASTSGVYEIDVDGAQGPIDSESVYCEMTIDGGGWTLAASNARSSELLPATGQAIFISTPGLNRNVSPETDYVIGPLMFTLDFSEALIVAQTGTRALMVRNTAALYPFVSPIEYSYDIIRDDFGYGVCLSRALYFVLGCKEKDSEADADNNQNTTGACIVTDPSGDPSAGVSVGLGVDEGSFEGFETGDCEAMSVDYYVTYVR